MTTPQPIPSRHLLRLPGSYAIAKAQAQKAELIKRGVDVLDLSIGEPDLPPPPPLLEALERSAKSGGFTRYPPSGGTPELRRAIARYYQRRFKVELDPDREVLPLLGSKEGLVHLALAFSDEDKPVYARSVDYPAYRSAAQLAGAPLLDLGGTWEDGYRPTLPASSARGGVIFLGSPSNPTGAVVREDALREVMAQSLERQAILAFDAAYVDLPGSGEKVAHPLAIDRQFPLGLEFHTFSKSLRVPGWRVAFAVGAPPLLQSLARMKSFVDAGVPLPQQLAIASALDHCDGYIDEGAQIYRARQAAFRKALKGLPLEPFRDDATLFCWCRLTELDGDTFAQAAIEEGLLVMSGSAFGPGGARCIRMAVNVGEAELPKLRARLEAAFERAKRSVR